MKLPTDKVLLRMEHAASKYRLWAFARRRTEGPSCRQTSSKWWRSSTTRGVCCGICLERPRVVPAVRRARSRGCGAPARERAGSRAPAASTRCGSASTRGPVSRQDVEVLVHRPPEHLVLVSDHWPGGHVSIRLAGPAAGSTRSTSRSRSRTARGCPSPGCASGSARRSRSSTTTWPAAGDPLAQPPRPGREEPVPAGRRADPHQGRRDRAGPAGPGGPAAERDLEVGRHDRRRVPARRPPAVPRRRTRCTTSSAPLTFADVDDAHRPARERAGRVRRAARPAGGADVPQPRRDGRVDGRLRQARRLGAAAEHRACPRTRSRTRCTPTGRPWCSPTTSSSR